MFKRHKNKNKEDRPRCMTFVFVEYEGLFLQVGGSQLPSNSFDDLSFHLIPKSINARGNELRLVN